ncbi:Nucleotide-binding oligomerization domain-containing protein 1 [Hondaea fermentalgiana]|uniref:Splicing factor Cactin n=1 Tax=Hondaea fermentalgiana TaxID=2315210 RepID=A0A2R5GBT3_9STRA|nr:Nucleotide-binding oligomerization domain-containing protein 1 [Hondaea fermentalgiana]|eukprot:GBG28045.1 Nucleotide-binding oligomerization domain-containing protein 1 [Hondaea fermentalgiana]
MTTFRLDNALRDLEQGKTHLSLDRNVIDDHGALQLGLGLLENRSLEDLSIRRNLIAAGGARELARSLETNTSLQSLSLAENHIGDEGAEALGQALQQNATLEKLLYDTSVGGAGLKALAMGIEQNTALKSLLEDGVVDDDDDDDAFAERSQQLVSMLGYSNEDNPFARIRELEEVRQRRQQRILDQEAFQKSRDEQQAQREIELYGTWEDKDEAFDRSQEKNRSRLRLLNHRAQLIDKLYTNELLVEEKKPGGAEELAEGLHLDGKVRPNLQNPIEILDRSSAANLSEALEIAERFIQSGLNSDLWNPIVVVMKDLVAKMKGRKLFDARIDALLRGKTVSELESLRSDIEENRIGKGLGDDEYWARVLGELKVSVAKLQSSTRNETLLQELGVDAAAARKEEREAAARAKQLAEEKRKAEEEEERRRRQQVRKLDESHFRPHDDPSLGAIVDDTQDRLARHKQRRAVVAKESEIHAERVYFSRPGGRSARHASGQRSARPARRGGGLGDDEAEDVDQLHLMSERDEIELPRDIQPWFARYEPRKPRYQNRVRAGYEWNKYNKTHYDKENPPPKVIQGYKFRLDYTELIDRSKAPSYKVLPFPGDEDYAILRFHAGPPYLDLAFKIVNREWRIRRKQGFSSSFEKGILKLNFQLKKPRYRRKSLDSF